MKLYGELASWWPLMSPVADYEEEAGEYVRLLRGRASGPLREVLELGSGGGHNASFMKQHFDLTLVDPSDGMRAVSQRLNPECHHLPGDMRTVRLGRTFDGVFVHDAVDYMLTEADLGAALQTVAAHLRPGGVAVVAPDATTESFEPGLEAEDHAEVEDAGADPRRALAWMEWSLPVAPGQTSSETHYVFLLREGGAPVRVVHDVHQHGLFPQATWLRLFDACGLDARLEPRLIQGKSYDTFVAVRRG